MRNDALAWYPSPWPCGTRFHEQHLFDPDQAAEVLAHAQAGVARITAAGWSFLWNHYGLDGLLCVARRAEFFEEGLSDGELADRLIRQSMIAGYDPVSGFFGRYSEEANEFELVGR